MSERILADRYRLVEQIGSGGMAIVYRAIDERTGHSVAVKVLRPDLSSDADYVSRFQREAEAASKMTHHNIVNLLDVGMDGENRYLVMEYVQGQTLKQVVQEKGRLSAATAAQITIRILSALQHAHSNGIIHRDIKPQNILVNAEGHIKVADFGIARMADSQTITRGDIVMGSVHYFSPEQASGQNADTRSDIYSVGVTLYEMLTGRVPFDGETQVAIAMQHLHAQPIPIETLAPDCPPAIAHVCMVALSKDPKYRYQTAREMAQELRMAMEGHPELMQARLAEPLSGDAPMSLETSKRSQPPARTPAQRPPAQPPQKVQRSRRTRLNIFWWFVTALVAAGVFYGLYVGGQAIYERVVNSADVPYLVGMDQSSAEQTVTQAGLQFTTIYNNHPTVPSGTVMLQAPETGTTLRKGDTVVITVSVGPASFPAPSVVGLTKENALREAKDRDLILEVTYEVNANVAEGFVVAQEPESNTPCVPGDIIHVTVSGGAAIVPDVKGRSLQEAQDLLAEAGLKVSAQVSVIPTEDDALHALVASQSVDVGVQVTRNTSITLTLYQKASLMRSADLTLKLPNSDSMLSVRVTLRDEGTGEITAYTGEYATDATRNPTVRVTAWHAGSYKCSVYINGDLAYEENIVIE